jgi:type II secretory pathway component GspD/PulD (secretin)
VTHRCSRSPPGARARLDAFLPYGDATDPDETLAGAVSIQSGLNDVFEPVSDPGVGFFRYVREPLLIPIIGPGGIPIEVLVPREIVQITAAEGTVTARTLLRPHLLALSGEEHELVSGDNVPVLIGASDAAGEPVVSDPLTIRNDIERRDVGMILRVKPTAGQAGDVRL